MTKHVAIIGGGHNGLVCAAYLARGGARVTVLERRDILGGACVTEELWPGYRISRAAYVLSLLRPAVARELGLERHGLRLLPRQPSSFTPLPDGRSLVLGADPNANQREIAKFSERDAEVFPRYEALLEKIARAFEPLLDCAPPSLRPRRASDLRPWWVAMRTALALGRDLPEAARILLAPARPLLEEWFDSEPLRSTLATDAVIGAYASPSMPGTGYVLFHHVMGSITGTRGVWAYVEGGMGGLTRALEGAARAAGASLRTGTAVESIVVRGRATTVVLEGGEEIAADAVVSSADLARTLGWLDGVDPSFARRARGLDYRSPVVKLNLALREAPRFRVSDRDEAPLSGTIHIGALDLDSLDAAYDAATAGQVAERPVVELTLPSTVDRTLAPEGRHVASIFAQYAPALEMDDPAWGTVRDRMQERALAMVDEVAPGFSESIEHVEVLAPPDLERIFGLTGGNIFHGAMTPDRLHLLRPMAGAAQYRTPIEGLYLCGSSTHPGGGVMGACGRNAAREILSDLRAQGIEAS